LNALGFGRSLLRALRHPITADKAADIMWRRVESRVENFISLLLSAVFSKPGHPYDTMLRSAGYPPDRLAGLIRSMGIEDALLQLARDGVYLSVDEFKGKMPVIRNGVRLNLNPSDLDMASDSSVPLQSSGSRGPRMRTPIDVEGLQLLASYIPLILRGLDAGDQPVVLYYPMPSVPGIVHLITFALAGACPAAWFSQVPHPGFFRSIAGMELALLIGTARALGIHLPGPRAADIRNPITLVLWILRSCPAGAVIATFPGSALRLVRTAIQAGIRLPSLIFILGGEPITRRKREYLEKEGHRVFPWYSSVETGRIAVGCFNPAVPDDMHLLSDRLAAIIRPRTVDSSGLEREALLVTTLLTDSYKLLINVETGDEACLENRSCGCLWERLGLTLHIHSIQSFEKLTLEGMTYVVDSLARLAEDILPARFGGTAGDYQFLEEEEEEGLTRLVVLVRPGIEAEEDLLRETVLEALREAAPIVTPMTDLLERASAITVRREHPRMTPSGKILPLRIRKPPGGAG